MKLAGKKVGLMPTNAGDATSSKPPLKKTGNTDGKPNKLGGGGRFQQLVNQGKSPALAAYIGRKTLGKNKFQKLAAKGKSA